MPRININMKWLIPVATAVWAVVTWTLDHRQKRREERARIAALYVNPFLAVCHRLQSRIYSILELGGLASLREHYPDGAYADETLFLIVQCFGWMVAVERHGPYTQDPVVMRLTSAVRSAFATSTSPQQVGPFNFYYTEQHALGKLVMTTTRGEFGVEFDSISYYAFKRHLASPPLSESKSVQETLEALRNADDVRNLLGRDRLAEVQNHLVELIGYVEGREGYTLFAGERKSAGGRPS